MNQVNLACSSNTHIHTPKTVHICYICHREREREGKRELPCHPTPNHSPNDSSLKSTWTSPCSSTHIYKHDAQSTMKLVSGQTLFSKSQETARKREGEREREGERKWVTRADKSKVEEQAGRDFR